MIMCIRKYANMSRDMYFTLCTSSYSSHEQRQGVVPKVCRRGDSPRNLGKTARCAYGCVIEDGHRGTRDIPPPAPYPSCNIKIVFLSFLFTKVVFDLPIRIALKFRHLCPGTLDRLIRWRFAPKSHLWRERERGEGRVEDSIVSWYRSFLAPSMHISL